ncbi:hypothetical protein [Nostoc sp.]
MDTYASKYSNELNDEWVFEFDYNALAGTLTGSAKWFAQSSKNLLRLKDISDVQAWLEGRYLEKFEMRDMPNKIEVCPGVSITIPKFR